MEHITEFEILEIAERALGTDIKRLQALIARKNTKKRRTRLFVLKQKQQAVARKLYHEFRVSVESLYNDLMQESPVTPV